ncbi:hypothetical protein G6L37_05615 [Agrobacterium rubi]|nr:hypothetical protein [Agrobacterium rubi]NTF24836.1 hypothetical protein [Agrobacterium rubi]
MKRSAHLLGIRHHGPGSAALLKGALDALDPACVLIEGPSEGDALIPHAALSGMKPPLAMMFYAADEAKNAVFSPFAEYSPEWVAMRWALARGREVRFIDWPAAVSLALRKADIEAVMSDDAGEDDGSGSSDGAEAVLGDDIRVEMADPLDILAEMAGYSDGETFWNGLIEQGGTAQDPLAVFSAIEEAMTEARAQHGEDAIVGSSHALRDIRREAFMRSHIREALRKTDGPVAAVVGAWHVGGLRAETTIAEDKAIMRDLPRIKVDATWAPWSDSRLAFSSGYGAGVVSPGWYRHLWSLYANRGFDGVEKFAAVWQAMTASLLREEGHEASTASAIEAARLSIGLAGMRNNPVPGLSEMRDASLAVLCGGDEVLFSLVERKLYIGERIGEIDKAVPQMPLAQDFEKWCKKTRMRPSQERTELKLDLRTEVGLARSTFLHRLGIIGVNWGQLAEAEAGRGTFREIWHIEWSPEMSVQLAEALVWGLSIEQAAGNRTVSLADEAQSISELAELVRKALIADLPEAATICIEKLQAAAVVMSDLTDIMKAVVPLARIARYGTSRKLPEQELRSLITAMAVEINAGIRITSHQLEDQQTAERVDAMRNYDEVLGPFGDEGLQHDWQRQLELIVDDGNVVSPVAGLSLRRLHDQKVWGEERISAAFSRHIVGEEPKRAGGFLESFLKGAAEILVQDAALLFIVDGWLSELDEETFIETLPLLRRAFSEFESSGRRRVLERVSDGRREVSGVVADADDVETDESFARALPLLKTILGIAA